MDLDTTPGRDRTDSNPSLLQPQKGIPGKRQETSNYKYIFSPQTRKIFLFLAFWARRIKIHKMYGGAGLWVKRLHTYSTGCTCSGSTLALARKTCRQPPLSGPPEDSGYQLGETVVGRRNALMPQGWLIFKQEDPSEWLRVRIPVPAKDHSNRSL